MRNLPSQFKQWLCLSAILFLASMSSLPLQSAEEPADPAQLDFFEARIRPVLIKNCYQCHSTKAKSVKGNLLLDSRTATRKGGDSGAALVPGKPADSLLLDALKYEGLEMPPKGKLSPKIIADFETWIRQGAVDPRDGQAVVARPQIDFEKAKRFWSFQAPRTTAAPKIQSPWINNEIDRFVLNNLHLHQLAPNPPARRRVLIRRAALDLTGLPPTIEEVNNFLADKSPGAFGRVVDRLLDSTAYGERWGRHWLDVARYGEDQAHTFKARKYPRGYFYRDWVVKSLNADLPYNQFLFQQLAADLVPGNDQHEHLPALGFFALGPVYYAENVEKAKAIADEWDDRIDTLTRGVLGLTVSCARCHDHKYDPITMEDYYGLAGVFASTQYQERPIAAPQLVQKKKDAEQAVKDHQLEIDRFLVTASRDLRPALAERIPDYFLGTWQFLNKRKVQKDEKKLYGQIAKDLKLSQTLLRRWVSFLSTSDAKTRERHPALKAWYAWFSAHDFTMDLSADPVHTKEIANFGDTFSKTVTATLPRRETLLARYGENVDFIKSSDRAKTKAGVIPLGNLFDDTKVVPLASAIATDKFKASATTNSRGVLRIVQGWGAETSLAPDISFRFTQLGSDTLKHGLISNDSWGDGGLRTRGKRISPTSRRAEQGIGMHANALITFDLDEIRRAGLMPQDQAFRFKVTRAGINDDIVGSKEASSHMAVILSRPHKVKEVLDAILSVHVNGKSMETDFDDFTYYISSPIPPPVLADGNFHAYDLAVPPEARYLTLVTTAAGHPDDNPISCDHNVFSGARLEMDPLPRGQHTVASTTAAQDVTADDVVSAHLLSRLLYDEGLLALPPNEAKSQLQGTAADKFKALEATQQQMKKAVAAITIPLAHALRDAKSQDIKIYLQGDPAKQAAIAPRSMPAIFTDGQKSPFNSKGSGRLELAKALTSADNPLTARVMVNRIWAAHFGRGLVTTTSNFGKLGARPSHPALLDYLADRFTGNGWSLKNLHRHIMLSATYQQSSDYRQEAAEIDGDNQWLWRMNRRRLDIEAWRDSMLFASGELDTTVGGPSLQLGDQKNKRRTLYGFVSRHRLDELLRLFDFPDPNITSATRAVTTVPLQQLFVLNSDFMAQRAKALAARIEKEASQDLDLRLGYAFELLYQRPATPADIALARSFLESSSEEKSKLTPWQQYVMALLAANEFMYVD